MADLEDEGKWLSWPTFREAVAQLQLNFDATGDDEPTPESARLLHDLTVRNLPLPCFALSDADADATATPGLRGLAQVALYDFVPFCVVLTASCSRSGEVAAIEYWPVDEITAERGNSTLSKWVVDHRKNVLTRRENSCYQLFIANSKVSCVFPVVYSFSWLSPDVSPSRIGGGRVSGGDVPRAGSVPRAVPGGAQLPEAARSR